jgi:glutathione S-transferase
MTDDLTLYYSPGSCSRVPMIQLEQAGAAYALRRVSTQKGETRTEAYRRINPKGKVPVLVDRGRVVTENVAIAFHLAQRFPDAELLPPASQTAELVEALSLMAWCASGLHPLIGRMRLPQRVGGDDAHAQARVKELAAQELADQLEAAAEPRLKSGPWLLGDGWCAADAYLFWVCLRGQESGLDLGRFPGVAGHVGRMQERPAVRAALEREAAAEAGEGLSGQPKA